MPPQPQMLPDIEVQQLAQRVREACIQQAVQAFEDAGADGLCCQGAWESAVSAMQRLDLETLLRQRP